LFRDLTMAKKNIDNLEIIDSSKGVLITVKNYSSDLLMQQGAGVIILLGTLACVHSFSVPIFIPVLILISIAFLIYEIVYNIKDHYMMTIQGGSLEIIKGMYNSVIFEFPLNEIRNVYIKNKEGKRIISYRYGHSMIGPDINELRIQLSNSKDMLISAEMEYAVQVLVRDKILEQVAKHKN
jgi:hypothetical protein